MESYKLLFKKDELMNKEQIQAVFDRCGLGKMGENLSFKLWIKGFGDCCDEESLENYLIAYDFCEEKETKVDNFLFHFRIYRNTLKNQDLNDPFRFL